MLITNVTGNFFLKENDTATEMHLAVQEVDGTPIDLSAASKVEVVIGTLEGRYLTKTPTLLDKTGEFTFGLDEGDMLPTGDNLLEVHIFDETNSKRVAPSKGHYKLKVQRTVGALGLTVTTYTLDYFLSEVNRILFGLPQLLARGEALADRMDVLIEESEQVLDEMYTATDDSRTATANSIEATAAAELATQDAQRATVEADTATAEAIQATLDADNATQASIAQTQAANDATSGADAATMRANAAAGEAEHQANQAENAAQDANNATLAANTATDNANAASSRANTSASRADTAATNANNAANAANTAATEANTARDSANLAASLADGIATELRGYDNAIVPFSLETRYLKHQTVRFDGSTYKAKVETQGNPLPVAPARSNEWFDLVAEKGEKGDMGTGISILGKVDTVSELPASGSPGDAYLIGVNIHIWNGDGWLDGGPIQGPQGEIGPQGEVGVGLQYSWNGSQLGVKRADESTYTYRDLKGEKGDKGDNAKIITLDFVIPATDTTQVDGNLINVHDYVYDAAADSIQFYQNSRILYPGEDFEMEDGTFRLLNWTGYDDPANVTFYIKVTRSVFDIDPVQSHATVVGALGYTPARSEDITQVVYDLEEADTRLTAQLAQTAQVVNVKSFGAVGDNVTDDSEAFEKAYDYAVTNGLTLYIPNPSVEYKLSRPFKINTGIKIVGESKHKTVLNFSSMPSGSVFEIAKTTSTLNVEIESLYVKGNKSIGLFDIGSSDPSKSLTDSHFRNIYARIFKLGIKTTRSWMNTFTNCRFHDCTQPFDFESQTNATHFDTCSFTTFSQQGKFSNCEGITFTGANISNITSAIGFTLFQSTVVMINPYFEHVQDVLAYIGASSEVIPSSLMIEGGIISGAYQVAGNDASLYVNGSRVTRIGGNPNIQVRNASVAAPQRYTKNLRINLNNYSMTNSNKMILDYRHNTRRMFDGASGGSQRYVRLYRDLIEFEQTVAGNGLTLSYDLVAGKQYTLAYAIRRKNDVNVNMQIDSNQSLSISSAILNDTEEWEVRYMPFVSSGARLKLLFNGVLEVKMIQVYEGIVNTDIKLPLIDQWNSDRMPAEGTWNRGDIVYNTGTDLNVTLWKRITTGSGHTIDVDWKAV